MWEGEGKKRERERNGAEIRAKRREDRKEREEGGGERGQVWLLINPDSLSRCPARQPQNKAPSIKSFTSCGHETIIAIRRGHKEEAEEGKGTRRRGGGVITRGVRLRGDQRGSRGPVWSSLIVSFYVIATPSSPPPPTPGNHRRSVSSSFYKGVQSVASSKKINLKLSLFCETLVLPPYVPRPA